jgi:hypothetical protein
LPARAGEVLRAIYLGKEEGIGSSFVFATWLVERMMDVIGDYWLSFHFLPGNVSSTLLNAIKVMAILGGLELLVMFLLPFIKGHIIRLMVKLPVSGK